MAERPRILVWVSAGAASAVAWKIAEMRYGRDCDVQGCYCDLSQDEHPDNVRFLAEIERWVGKRVTRLRHPKYATVEEAWRGERFIVGPFGASCSRTMKREVREAYQRPDDRHVFGLTADEAGRIADFSAFHPELACLWLLSAGGITKEDCYHVLSAAGIELPAMYRIGFHNNNCLGCCKGGKGYWNKVRRHFPAVFEARAKVQRELNVQFGGGEYRFFLDELDPAAGQDVPEPPIECGMFCNHYTTLLDRAIVASPSPAVAASAGHEGRGK